MVDRRELSRREARRQRAAERSETFRRVDANCELAANAIGKARMLVADPDFIKILLQHGIRSIPKCLDGDASTTPAPGDSTRHHELNRISLEFAVVWKFLYPLLTDANAKEHLEATRPGFISLMKDTFIALVIDGPFPHAMSGHRGRKHYDNPF
jgi:hypothetical protein